MALTGPTLQRNSDPLWTRQWILTSVNDNDGLCIPATRLESQLFNCLVTALAEGFRNQKLMPVSAAS
jgi:hypothetical protein